MNTVLSITDARKTLPALVEKVAKTSQQVFLTVKGRVKVALISAEELLLMQETIELLSDTEAMSSIRQGRKEIQHKDIISWDEVKKEIPLLDN